VNGNVTVTRMYLIHLIFCTSKVLINTQFLPHYSVHYSEHDAFKEDIKMGLVACGYFNLTNYTSK